MIVPDDPEMLKGIKEGDESAFKKMYNLYNPIFLRFAIGYLKMRKSEAEDVVADAWGKAFIERERFISILQIFRFIGKVIKNKRIDKWRMDVNHKEIIYDWSDFRHEDEIADESENLARLKEKERQEILMFLRQLLEELPTKRKEILVASLFKEMSTVDMANEFNISSQTVWNTKINALKQLRDRLKASHIYASFFS